MLKTVAITSSGGGGGGTGTVTLVNTDANLTGGPITTTGTIGLAANISFYSGNVTTSNANVGTSVVNINMLNAAVNGLNAQIPVNYASTANLSVTYSNGTAGVGATLTATANGALSLDGSSLISIEFCLFFVSWRRASRVTNPKSLVGSA